MPDPPRLWFDFIAAENTAGICRGVELDPPRVDVIVRRKEVTSGEAGGVYWRPGETFEESRAAADSRAGASGKLLETGGIGEAPGGRAHDAADRLSG